MITLSRIYDEKSVESGKTVRILVDRLWPRGVSKERLSIDRWMRGIAPSDELRKWYSHDPKKWDEFCIRYFAELDGNPLTEELLEICRNREVVLLYSSKVADINNAVALKKYVEERV